MERDGYFSWLMFLKIATSELKEDSFDYPNANQACLLCGLWIEFFGFRVCQSIGMGKEAGNYLDKIFLPTGVCCPPPK